MRALDIFTSMGGLCKEGHDFLRLCKKRNKGATLRLLDVLVTQHARWTARRIRRALFGQSLVDFAGSSWSSVKIHKSASEPTMENKRKAQVSRLTQEFSQAVAVTDAQPYLVPGMSQYSFSQEFSQVEDAIGSADDLSSKPVNSTEDFREADQQSAAITQRTEFFTLSP